MQKKRKEIPNPNAISIAEQNFLESTPADLKNPQSEPPSTQRKKILISFPEKFLIDLDEYLKENPTEGNRTSFVVRAVGEYLYSKIRDNK